MKRLFVGLLVLFFCVMVFAESSEITTEFTVGNIGEGHTSSLNFLDVYGGYLSGLAIVLIVLIVFLKNQKLKASKKVKKKKKK